MSNRLVSNFPRLDPWDYQKFDCVAIIDWDFAFAAREQLLVSEVWLTGSDFHYMASERPALFNLEACRLRHEIDRQHAQSNASRRFQVMTMSDICILPLPSLCLIQIMILMFATRGFLMTAQRRADQFNAAFHPESIYCKRPFNRLGKQHH